MSARYVRDGQTVDVVAESAIAAGDVVQVGGLLGVALRPIAVGDTGALQLEGVFEFDKGDAAFEVGDAVHFHIPTGHAVDMLDTSEESSGEEVSPFLGYCTKAAAHTDTTVHVRIRNAHSPLD